VKLAELEKVRGDVLEHLRRQGVTQERLLLVMGPPLLAWFATLY
jgi:hypothetical protein